MAKTWLRLWAGVKQLHVTSAPTGGFTILFLPCERAGHSQALSMGGIVGCGKSVRANVLSTVSERSKQAQGCSLQGWSPWRGTGLLGVKPPEY